VNVLGPVTLPDPLPLPDALPLSDPLLVPEPLLPLPDPLPELPLPEDPLLEPSEDPLLEVPLPEDPLLEVPLPEEPVLDPLPDPLLEPVPPEVPLCGGVVGMIPPPQPTRKRPATTTTPILSMKFPLITGIGIEQTNPLWPEGLQGPKEGQISDCRTLKISLGVPAQIPNGALTNTLGNFARSLLLKAKVTPRRHSALLRKDVAEPRSAGLRLR
jgi:hypothetical protein